MINGFKITRTDDGKWVLHFDNETGTTIYDSFDEALRAVLEKMEDYI